MPRLKAGREVEILAKIWGPFTRCVELVGLWAARHNAPLQTDPRASPYAVQCRERKIRGLFWDAENGYLDWRWKNA